MEEEAKKQTINVRPLLLSPSHVKHAVPDTLVARTDPFLHPKSQLSQEVLVQYVVHKSWQVRGGNHNDRSATLYGIGKCLTTKHILSVFDTSL